MPSRRISFLAPLLVLAICVPLVVPHHTLPLATFYGEWASALGFSLFVVGCGLARATIDIHEAQRRLAIPTVAWLGPWLIAVTLAGLASGRHDVTGSGALTIVTLLLATVVMLAGQRLRATLTAAATIDAIATAFLIAGLLGTLAQWVQVFRLEPHSWNLVSPYFYDSNRRLWGNLNQPNHQATVHGLALAASVWLASRGKLRVAPWLVAVVLIESGIVLSGSRTGMLHVILAALYAMVASWLARGRPRSHGPMARPAGLAFAAVALLGMLMLLQPAVRGVGHAFGWELFDTVAQLQAADQTSARQALWTHAWAIFRTYPWLGAGWGEFGWAQFEQLAPLGVTVEMSLHAHNAVLDLLAKTGVAGAGGVVAMLALWLWRVARRRLWRAQAEERASAAAALTWLAMLCAHSMLEYPLHYLYFLLPFCLLLGWLEPGLTRLPAALPARVARPLATLLFGFVAAAGLALLWQDYRRVEAAEYAETGMEARMPLPSPLMRPYAMANRAERARLDPDNASDWLPHHRAAVHLLPTPTMIARTAWLMALTGQQDEARQWLERLRYYYNGDLAGQLARTARYCQQAPAGSRPEAFCAWVSQQPAGTSRR